MPWWCSPVYTLPSPGASPRPSSRAAALALPRHKSLITALCTLTYQVDGYCKLIGLFLAGSPEGLLLLILVDLVGEYSWCYYLECSLYFVSYPWGRTMCELHWMAEAYPWIFSCLYALQSLLFIFALFLGFRVLYISSYIDLRVSCCSR